MTEEVVAAMLQQVPGCDVLVESNNGGRGFARAVSRLCPNHRIGWFCQSANKEARILSNASAVLRNICMPVDWRVGRSSRTTCFPIGVFSGPIGGMTRRMCSRVSLNGRFAVRSPKR